MQKKLDSCIFENVHVNNAILGGGKKESFLENCHFVNSKFNIVLGFSTLIDCTFENVTIGEMFALTMQFINCKFSGKLKKVVFNAEVPESDLVYTGRDKNIFQGNDLSGADFKDVGFRGGIDFYQQKMPTYDDYLYIYNPEVIQKAKAKLSILHDKKYSVPLLDRIRGMQFSTIHGQKNFFLKLSELTKIAEEKEEIRELFHAKD